MKSKFYFSFLLACSLLIITILVSPMVSCQELKNNNTVNYKLENINETVTTEKLSTIYSDSTNTTKDLYLENESVVQVFKSSSKSLELSPDDIHLMAKIVYAESKGEPYKGKVAVASVILNRAIDPNFPNTVEGVVKQKNAFSCVKNGEINVVPNSDSYNAVMDAIKGNDPTNKALYFYNPTIATCNWMHNIEKKNVQSIGRHVFFEV